MALNSSLMFMCNIKSILNGHNGTQCCKRREKYESTTEQLPLLILSINTQSAGVQQWFPNSTNTTTTTTTTTKRLN